MLERALNTPLNTLLRYYFLYEAFLNDVTEKALLEYPNIIMMELYALDGLPRSVDLHNLARKRTQSSAVCQEMSQIVDLRGRNYLKNQNAIKIDYWSISSNQPLKRYLLSMSFLILAINLIQGQKANLNMTIF